MSVQNDQQLIENAKVILKSAEFDSLPKNIQEALTERLVIDVLKKRQTGKIKPQTNVGGAARGLLGYIPGAKGLLTTYVTGESEEDLQIKQAAIIKESKNLSVWINQFKGHELLSEAEKNDLISRRYKNEAMSSLHEAVFKKIQKHRELQTALKLQEKILVEVSGFNMLSDDQKKHYIEKLNQEKDFTKRNIIIAETVKAIKAIHEAVSIASVKAPIVEKKTKSTGKKKKEAVPSHVHVNVTEKPAPAPLAKAEGSKARVNDSSIIVREQIILARAQLEQDKEFQKLPNDLKANLESRLISNLINKKLIEIGSLDALNNLNASLFESVEGAFLYGLKHKYESRVPLLKEELAKLSTVANIQLDKTNIMINVTKQLENSSSYSALKALPADSKLKEINTLTDNILKLNNNLEMTQKYQNFINNPNKEPGFNHPDNVKHLPSEKQVAFYQAEILRLNSDNAGYTREILKFQEEYYSDIYLDELDKIFGHEKPSSKGLLQKALDLFKDERYSKYNPLYNKDASWAMVGGVGLGIAGAALAGPIAAVAGFVAGSAGCYVQPKLVIPVVAAAAGAVAGPVLVGGSAVGLVGSVAAGAAVGVGAEIVIAKVPAFQAILDKVKSAIPNLLAKTGSFISYPFTEFADAYKQYKSGHNKLYHGMRMFGIVLGAAIGVTGFALLNVVTGGTVTAAILGTGIVGLATANIGAYSSKTVTSLKSESKIKVSAKFMLENKTIAMLGKDGKGNDNAEKIGEHFQLRISELEKIIAKIKKEPITPENARELADRNADLAYLEATMEAIKNAGSDPEILKKIIDDYLKAEYKEERASYVALTSININTNHDIEPVKKQNIMAVEVIKRRINELSEFSLISKHLESKIKTLTSQSPSAVATAATAEHAQPSPHDAPASKPRKHAVSSTPHHDIALAKRLDLDKEAEHMHKEKDKKLSGVGHEVKNAKPKND